MTSMTLDDLLKSQSQNPSNFVRQMSDIGYSANTKVIGILTFQLDGSMT